MSSLLQLQSLSCGYENTLITEQLDLTLAAGEIACLLGPSGCGKTTVLRAIAGFSPVLSGAIIKDGQPVSTPVFTLPPEQREIGVVFQDYALFPHLSVFDNIAFGLQGKSRAEKQRAVTELLQLVELPDLSDRYPHELSGGQQQRVALARALAPRPKLLLMDEPFSNLDTDLRRQLALEVRGILKDQGIAAIMVTHDQEEAFAISDKIGILADRKLQQWGTPPELYYHPVNPQVAGFVGKGELYNGECLNETTVKTELGTIEFAEPFGASEGKKLSLFIRPADIRPSIEHGDVMARIEQKEFLGCSVVYQLSLPSGRQIEAEIYEPLMLDVGAEVSLHVAAHRPIAFEL
ncbi:ABC transporter ATP-binding protein [Amphritea balenae]|uniref:ABC transporter ATP-binding protein n=1 Tax=Amphritea balenae TaxID=452629 RepID=A0A3P1SSK4_9GAMM|nr:ABC transporter ATP-binding protein [Amphritea balenae]RRD00111.1 ABC transporter ATP-binding protein [Amphritea balenae]GGK76721.1 ABC transporter ATP-binding protein [Amphritea balenae]